MALPDELFKLIPLYTAEGKQYGYTLEKWNGPDILIFSDSQLSISDAVVRIKELDIRNDAFFDEIRNEALDPNR